MFLLKQKIASVINKNPLAGFATLTKSGMPWVRYVTISSDSDLTLRFASHIDARKIGQIKLNSDVHLTCGATDPKDTSRYIQIQGRAEVSTKRADRHKLWNSDLKKIFDGPNDPAYCVVIIKPHRIEYCGEGEPEVWTAKGAGVSPLRI